MASILTKFAIRGAKSPCAAIEEPSASKATAGRPRNSCSMSAMDLTKINSSEGENSEHQLSSPASVSKPQASTKSCSSTVSRVDGIEYCDKALSLPFQILNKRKFESKYVDNSIMKRHSRDTLDCNSGFRKIGKTCSVSKHSSSQSNGVDINEMKEGISDTNCTTTKTTRKKQNLNSRHDDEQAGKLNTKSRQRDSYPVLKHLTYLEPVRKYRRGPHGRRPAIFCSPADHANAAAQSMEETLGIGK